MMDKHIIENYLRANGLDAGAPDEEIKSVLFSAKWHAEDIDTALMVLRENRETHKTRVDSVRKVFHSDDKLKPETISALLGIDVHIPQTITQNKVLRSRMSYRDILIITGISIVFAAFCLLSAMWYLRIGMFYGL